MNILLINPPQTFYPGSQWFCKYFPTGLASLAAVLEADGFSVAVLDTLMTGFERLERDDITQYGMAWQNIRRELEQRQPDILGMTSPFSAQIENAITLAALAKEVNPAIVTIIGGPAVSVRASELLQQSSAIDIAVIGEGEMTLLEIASLYQQHQLERLSSVAGIAYRTPNDVRLTAPRPFIKNLDDLPLPAYHLFDMEAYLNEQDAYLYAGRMGGHLREIPMTTSRGCPYQCVFCSIHLHMGKPWRAHSANYVLEHIRHLIQRYGVQHIHFEDDNFTLNRQRTEQILDGIIANSFNVTWDTPNGVRADHLGRAMLQKMKLSGCQSLNIAIESGDQTVLDTIIGKRLQLADVLRSITHCSAVGIPVNAFFVVGFPGETLENMERSALFAEQIALLHGVVSWFFAATPLYGTRLYERCMEGGYIATELTPRALSEGTQDHGTPLIQTPDFTTHDLKRFLRDVSQRIERKLLLRQQLMQRFKCFGRFQQLAIFCYVSPAGVKLRTLLAPLLRQIRNVWHRLFTT